VQSKTQTKPTHIQSECYCIAGHFGGGNVWLYWRLGSIVPNLNTAK